MIVSRSQRRERINSQCSGYNNHVPLAIHQSEARSILSHTSGFIAEAGFTHSLTPARNCTFACTYCYVPTMRVQAGLRRDDWVHWGQSTTFKSNAAGLAARELRPGQRIYCSPLTDPYQPAEADAEMMPRLLDALAAHPPAVLAIQTRGSLILRDVARLRAVAAVTGLRISFSLTTDRDDVRRRYEPMCSPVEERLETMRALREAGLRVHATLAPILPCDPERLAALAIEATRADLIGDPFHTRAVKRSGATTRDAAVRVSAHFDEAEWHEPEFQRGVCDRIARAAADAGYRFATGPQGFSCLSQLT